MSVTWILEAEIFPESHSAMCDAVLTSRNELIIWRDAWLSTGEPPDLRDRVVVFHGSLGNASTIKSNFPWRPGAYCDAQAFCCSLWYPAAEELLVHRKWTIVPAKKLVAEQHTIAIEIGSPYEVFIRPNSPLKPFSGRVAQVGAISLSSLDFGFYYEDEALPVVVAPIRQIRREWRFVVVNELVVAGSEYDAALRSGLPDSPEGAAWRFAERAARTMCSPESVYVLDVCEADDDLHVLELNPFSGADLYSCDRFAVVDAVSKHARRDSPHSHTVQLPNV